MKSQSHRASVIFGQGTRDPHVEKQIQAASKVGGQYHLGPDNVDTDLHFYIEY